MPSATRGKEDRLQVRLDANSKAVLQRAAAYRHKTLSQFVLATALDEADRIIRENEGTVLSPADWTVFLDALTEPPKPNDALRAAFDRYTRSRL